MLERLRIRNLAIVEQAELELGPGLNVITGETGAGKSLLVGSLSLLVGGRAESGQVREGAEAAWVEGEFLLGGAAARRVREVLESWGVEFDGEHLIVRREVSAAGRSRAWVNQAAVTLTSLQTLGEALADLHGQHEHQSLLRLNAGSELLDRLGGCEGERQAYATARAAVREASGRLEELEQSLTSYAERREAMLEAAREIDELRPRAGEEQELKLEAQRLGHADRLRALGAQALARLAEGEAAAIDALAAAAHAVEQAAELDPTAGEALPLVDEARIAAAEASRTLSGYLARLEVDPGALEAVETRRDAVARLARKHRRDAAGLVEWRESLRAELAMGEDAEGSLDRARAEVERLSAGCRRAGRALSVSRRGAAREWGGRLTRELAPLGLPHARIEFAIEAAGEPDEFPAGGLERVEIRFTANAGEPAARLRTTASGGELSRVTLALKCALESQDAVDVRAFDEVDSGIGGRVAQAVGERLRSLARHGQVVCVTHLPMIAALAGRHLHVTKQVVSGRTLVRVERLTGRERVEELARMLAGDRVTDTTRRQARELIAASEGAGS